MPSYTPQTWANDVGGGTPLSAARLAVMETGIDRASVPTSSTSLPGSPFDGQEIYYAADATNGVYWHLRYRSASASAYKWEFLGGSPLTSEILTSETTGSTTYIDLATVGPSVTLPLAGDYLIEFTAEIRSATGGSSVAPKLGAAATSDNDSAFHAVTGSALIRVSRAIRRDGLAAAAVIKLQYKTGGTTFVAQQRNLQIRPFRVG